jgi:hypothetical protein
LVQLARTIPTISAKYLTGNLLTFVGQDCIAPLAL